MVLDVVDQVAAVVADLQVVARRSRTTPTRATCSGCPSLCAQFAERYVQVRRCRRCIGRALLGDAREAARRVARALERAPRRAIGAEAGFEQQPVRHRRRPRDWLFLHERVAGSRRSRATSSPSGRRGRASRRPRPIVRLTAAAVAARCERRRRCTAAARPSGQLNLLRGVAWVVRRMLAELAALGALRLLRRVRRVQ